LISFLLLLTCALTLFGAEPDSVRGKPLKSTTGAVLRSMVIPGWGQFYNESYVKAAGFALLQGTLIVSASHENDQMMRFKTGGDFRLEKFYRNSRNKLLWWLAGTILLSMGDAYVDAHLYKLDISPDLSYDRGLTPHVTATLHF
jgi:hypothetical protein